TVTLQTVRTDLDAVTPKDLPALLIALDPVSYAGYGLLFSSRSQLPVIAQHLDQARGICDRSRSRSIALDRFDPAALVKLDRKRHRNGREDRLARLDVHRVDLVGFDLDASAR